MNSSGEPPSNGSDSRPELSVIIPLPDHRGEALAAVESWTRRQTLDRSRYEVLLLGRDRSANLVAELDKLLGPGDRRISVPAKSLAELYNRGAHEARGSLLFITESHCVGDPHCLEEIVRFVSENELDGAYCRSYALARSTFPDMEQRLLDEEMERSRARPNVISVRGSALTRTTFLEAGGFQDEFGHFAEVLLGDALDRLGSRMGYADKAVVHHANTARPATLIAELGDYGRDECRHVATAGGISQRSCSAWDERNSYSSKAARARLNALLRRGPWIALRRPRSVLALGAGLMTLLPVALTGVRWAFWRSWMRILRARLLVRVSRADSDARYHAFLIIWRESIYSGGLSFLMEDRQQETLSEGPFDISQMDPRLIGFHNLEDHPEGPFRWSEPVSLILTAAAPGDYELTLTLTSLPRGTRSSFAFYFDGRRLKNLVFGSDPHTISCRLTASDFGSDPTHDLTWVCSPVPVDRSLESRRLGVPVKAFEMKAI